MDAGKSDRALGAETLAVIVCLGSAATYLQASVRN
jgi:hypothetical protein